MKRTYLFILVGTLLLGGCTQNNNGNTPVDNSPKDDQSPSTPIDDGYRTVSFDTKGGTKIDSQRILLGEKIVKPADPIKEGNSFITWTYDLEPWDFENGVVESDMVLEAQYSPNQYELVLAHYNNEEHGTITGNGTYTWGESVILNAVPDTGYAFAGWYKNEYKMLSAEATYVYTMGIDQTLYARWSAKLNNLSVVSENEEQGTVSIINGSGYTAESITVKATAKEGYSFVGWYHETVELSADELFTFTMPTSDYTVMAKFVSNETLLKRELGIIPVVANDRKTLTYGIYPQTIVSDQNLITTLDSLESPEANGWYKYNGRYYAKVNAKNASKLSDGTTTLIGERYWFKCEKVTWDIISENEGVFNVFCRVMINGTYTNLATIRNDTYNAFFNLNNDYINSADELLVLKSNQTLSLSLEIRKCELTDYSLTMDTYDYKEYWTSSTSSTTWNYVFAYTTGKQDEDVVQNYKRLFYRFSTNFNLGV